jgi:hypothetical protein
MVNGTVITEQLVTMGVLLPGWPEEAKDEGPTIGWILRGQDYAEGLRLWRAQLRGAATIDSTGGERLITTVQNLAPQSAWDQRVIRYLLSDLRNDSDYRHVQAAVKFAAADGCTAAQRLGAAIDLARGGFAVCAVDAIKRLVEWREVSEQDCLEVCALLVANLQPASSVGVPNSSNEHVHWWSTNLALHLQAIRVLATGVDMACNEQNRAALAEQLETLLTLAAETRQGPSVDEREAIGVLKTREQWRQSRANEKQVLRTIHHLACSGGTVISKCLAAMPHVALISEVNPLNRFGSEFEPTNPLLQLERSYRKLSIQDIIEEFIRQVAHANRICQQDDVDLVIRDHSHTDFCIGPAPAAVCPIADCLSSDYELLSVVTVRHPLDSYLGLITQGWEKQFSPSNLNEYSRRYQSFLDRYASLPMLRYEDFCAQPEAFMKNLCNTLEIGYSGGFLGRFGDVTLSGDSGRKGVFTIEPRPRREVPEEVQSEIASSIVYSKLLDRLGYY